MQPERIAADDEIEVADWQRRVVGRSLNDARRRSIDRGARFIRAAAKVLERTNGESLTVQEVADEAGQSLRTLYQYFASKDDLLLAVYEESSGTYARMIRAAIAEVDEPVERLAAGLIAATRMPALHGRSGRRPRPVAPAAAAQPRRARAAGPLPGAGHRGVPRARRRRPSRASRRCRWESTRPPTSCPRCGRRSRCRPRSATTSASSSPIPSRCRCSASAASASTGRGAWHEAVDARLALSGDDGRSILRRLIKESTDSAK